MKSVYDAVRAILYPRNGSRRASLEFAQGTHPYALDTRIPSHMCQALMSFEKQNRGHRHLLGHTELRAERTTRSITDDDRNGERVRKTFRKSMRRLLSSVLALDHEPSDSQFQSLLNSYDGMNQLNTIVLDELAAACGNSGWTRLPLDFHVRDVWFSGDGTYMHLSIQRYADNARARRTIPLAQMDRSTLKDAKLFYKDCRSRVREAMLDVVLWREFAPHGAVVEVDRSSSYSDTSEGGRERILKATQQFAQAMSPAPETGLQRSTEPRELQTEVPGPANVKAESLARLQRHMQDFLSMYSADTLTLLSENWDQFRPNISK